MLVLYRLKDSSEWGGGWWKTREGAFLFLNFFRDPKAGSKLRDPNCDPNCDLTVEIASLTGSAILKVKLLDLAKFVM